MVGYLPNQREGGIIFGDLKMASETILRLVIAMSFQTVQSHDLKHPPTRSSAKVFIVYEKARNHGSLI